MPSLYFFTVLDFIANYNSFQWISQMSTEINFTEIKSFYTSAASAAG